MKISNGVNQNLTCLSGPPAGEAGRQADEKELLVQAKSGSIEAFEKIMFFYEKPIFNYIYRLVKHKTRR